MVPTAYGDRSIDFAHPEAVKALNRALLAHQYRVAHWDIPTGFLCPPVPGRADYIHVLADLLADEHGGTIPHGPNIRALDIGVGANCIYPLIGHQEYGWRFVGADCNSVALAAAERIVAANAPLRDVITLRRQHHPDRIFNGVIAPGDVFDLTLCNPPFHASLGEAQAGSRRKWRNLHKTPAGVAPRTTGSAAPGPVLNFGGQGPELVCPGGEQAFVARMIHESTRYRPQVLWFTTLVSKSATLPAVRHALQQAGVVEQRTIAMAQGQKQSRLVAWSYMDSRQRTQWAQERWGCSDSNR